MKRAILIDPEARSVKEVQIGDHYKEISRAIGCDYFCLAAQGLDDLYVDDEGLLKEGIPVFEIDGQLLAGRGLVLGRDGEGESCDARSTVASVLGRVQWTDLLTTGNAPAWRIEVIER